MQSDEIRSRFLKFFENRGHKIIPSASLVPENDPSVFLIPPECIRLFLICLEKIIRWELVVDMSKMCPHPRY